MLSSRIDGAILALKQVNPALVNDKNLALLESCPGYAFTMWNFILSLSKANPALVSDNNLALLAASNVDASVDAREIGFAMSALSEANPALATDANLALLAARGNHARNVRNVITALCGVDKTLVNKENFELLLSAKDLPGMSGVLFALSAVNPKLLNNENIKLMANLEYLTDIDNVIYGLGMIGNSQSSEPRLMNDRNFALLLADPQRAKKISKQLIALYEKCEQMINASKDPLVQQGIFSTPDLTAVDKFKKYICGHSSINFNAQELTVISRFLLDIKSVDIITIDSLPKTPLDKSDKSRENSPLLS